MTTPSRWIPPAAMPKPPTGLLARELHNIRSRAVSFTDLDRNGHMNNTRCMDWIADLLPSSFHAGHTVKEFTVCYLTESREGELIRMNWELTDDGAAQIDAHCGENEDTRRVFSAKLLFEE